MLKHLVMPFGPSNATEDPFVRLRQVDKFAQGSGFSFTRKPEELDASRRLAS
jgi:hypothetical protein